MEIYFSVIPKKEPLLPTNNINDRTGFTKPVLTVPFRHFALVTVSLPFGAFIICILYSYLFNFKASTKTHCNVFNFAPSISASISVFRPQNYIWRICLAIHSGPRLYLTRIYYYYYRNGLRGRFRTLVKWTHGLNVLENLFLLLLSFAPSKGEFLLHKIGFIGFLICSSLYLSLSYLIVKKFWWASRNNNEHYSVWLKEKILITNLSAILLAMYLYYRHNKYCEPGVYSLFSICEYTIVLSNMAYHFASYYDFHDRTITC